MRVHVMLTNWSQHCQQRLPFFVWFSSVSTSNLMVTSLLGLFGRNEFYVLGLRLQQNIFSCVVMAAVVVSSPQPRE